VASSGEDDGGLQLQNKAKAGRPADLSEGKAELTSMAGYSERERSSMVVVGWRNHATKNGMELNSTHNTKTCGESQAGGGREIEKIYNERGGAGEMVLRVRICALRKPRVLYRRCN
jgi:hypothetical protein